MIKYRDGIDVLKMLASCGYSTYSLRKQKIIGEARIQKLREGALPTWKELDFICWATAHDVGEILEHTEDGTVAGILEKTGPKPR